jgi:3,2-trans-enoyl-CoA isomerase
LASPHSYPSLPPPPLSSNKKLPVNSINLDFAAAFTKAHAEVVARKEIQSLILTSSCNSIFSAGLDIKEMHNPEPVRLREFWTAFQGLYLELYGSRLATIAAIEGHSPAGGCLIAMCCDYRIMSNTEKFKIGLNETKLGIAAPFWMGELLVQTVGVREAELALGLGKLYSPSEALKVGLVDEIQNPEDVKAKAQEWAAVWAGIPEMARNKSKDITRRAKINELTDRREEDLEWFADMVMQEGVQQNLTAYLESLKKKKK